MKSKSKTSTKTIKKATKNKTKTPKLSAKQKRLLDPFLQREIDKYKKPLPSREYILLTIQKSANQKLSFEELVAELGVKKSEYADFAIRLKAMRRDDQIISPNKNFYALADKNIDILNLQKTNEVAKIVSKKVSEKVSEKNKEKISKKSNKKTANNNENLEVLNGYVKVFTTKNNQRCGFFISDDQINPENGKPLRLLLNEVRMKTLLNGDKIKVVRAGFHYDIFRNGIEEARVIEVVEAVKPKIIGEIVIRQDKNKNKNKSQQQSRNQKKLKNPQNIPSNSDDENFPKIVFYPLDRRFNQKVNIVVDKKTKTIQKKSTKSRGKSAKTAKNNDATFEFDGVELHDHQIVEIQITQRADKHTPFQGEIIKIVGDANDSNIELDIALRQFDLPHIFSPQTLQELENFADELTAKDYKDKNRKDLRHLPFITIDGETAKDFDDAVYAEVLPNQNGYKLFVAIADVSHYVKPGMSLDDDALERATSVYFPQKVIPMLPEKLSNGLCSLNPNVDRLAMVCEINLGVRGKINDFQFYKAVFKSNARLTYTQVWQFLQSEVLQKKSAKSAKSTKSAKLKISKKVKDNLINLYATYKALLTSRKRRGAIEFQTQESQFIFNENGKIETIVAAEHNPAHSLIEECMLAANESAAKFIKNHKHACLYRIHGNPKPEKVEILKQHLHLIGLDLGSISAEHQNLPSAKDYAALVKQIKNRPDAEILQTLMLRTLPQAEYSPENIGHFGLNYKEYAHFTSPIRRYPDLLVHRVIKAILENKTYTPKKYKWEQLGEICSQAERRADDASRDVIAYLRCEFMKTKRHQKFDGVIVDISPQFINVSLKDIFLMAPIHVANLGDDYFYFNQKTLQMVGSKSGISFALGDKVSVEILHINSEFRSIEFKISKSKNKK